MRLSDLHTGDRAIIRAHHSKGSFRKRLLEMGFIVGKEILVVKNAPLQDPVEYRIMNYDVSLRRQEADLLEVEVIHSHGNNPNLQSQPFDPYVHDSPGITGGGASHIIRVAFVGNPNAGKTSLFNAASGAREHVGNYSGVTVEAKSATYTQRGYTFELVDLPGTYSISSYSPEEEYVARHLMGDHTPDVIINVVDATNLERHLYMTSQLMESGIPMVVALNMYDELEASGTKLDVKLLTKLLGIPFIPTVGRTGKGVKALFDQVIQLHENRSRTRRIVDIRYREEIESLISRVREALVENSPDGRGGITDPRIRPRYIALKLLEEDSATTELVRKSYPKADYLLTVARYARMEYLKTYNQDVQSAITDARYGFVSGALRETLTPGDDTVTDRNRRIDRILTHRIWGFPIFLLLMYLMFQATFTLGQYPMDWIEQGVAALGSWIGETMPEGMLRDLIVDGVIGGIGGVIVFLPNIVLLYLFIAIMEDTGYMSRAAFIMDRIMHMIGLHGKSFIPLVMGFGCNVPAIMATRTIESHNSRMMTMLIVPFMSCSARLPVYLLLAGAFFPHHAGLVLFVLYLLGILLAVVTALLLKKYLFAREDTPFVMELPPYRVPTPISVLLHMWTKAKQYLHKMASIILIASIIVWALGYFPLKGGERTEVEQAKISAMTAQNNLTLEEAEAMIHQENSYIGRIGHAIQPIFEPLGYDWRMSVALLSGAAAKEIVVSTMGVLYAGDSEDTVGLGHKLREAKDIDGTPLYDPVIIFSFMVFVLCYFPCIATLVAIAKESGSSKWALFSATYTVLLAWIMGFAITQIGHLFI